MDNAQPDDFYYDDQEVICPVCNGSGDDPWVCFIRKCEHCNGEGLITV